MTPRWPRSRTVVVVVHYGDREDTRRCVASLHRSHAVPPLVIVDNDTIAGHDTARGRSEADTGDAARDPWAETLRALPRAHVLRTGENLGFGAGANRGMRWALEHADPEFLLVLNHDTTVEPDGLARLEACLDAFPRAAIAAPRIVRMDDPDTLWYGGGTIDWFRGSARVPGFGGPADAPLALRAREVGFASGCAMLVRRSALEAVGGFDPRFFLYEEDVDLSLRALAQGQSIRYCPRAVVRHRVQGSHRPRGVRFRPRLHPANPHVETFLYYTVRNRLLAMSLHARRGSAVLFRCVFPVYVAGTCLRLAVRHGPRAFLPAICGLRDFRRLSTSGDSLRRAAARDNRLDR